MSARKPALRMRLLDVIVSIQADFGYAPTQRQLAAELKVSQTRIARLLVELREDKVVDWDDRTPRSLRLVRMTDA